MSMAKLSSLWVGSWAKPEGFKSLAYTSYAAGKRLCAEGWVCCMIQSWSCCSLCTVCDLHAQMQPPSWPF